MRQPQRIQVELLHQLNIAPDGFAADHMHALGIGLLVVDPTNGDRPPIDPEHTSGDLDLAESRLQRCGFDQCAVRICELEQDCVQMRCFCRPLLDLRNTALQLVYTGIASRPGKMIRREYGALTIENAQPYLPYSGPTGRSRDLDIEVEQPIPIAIIQSRA